MARVGFGGGGGSGSAFSTRALTGGETLAPFDEARVDTGSSNSDVTAPADGDSSDGDRIIVGKVDLGAGDVNLLANTGQSIIGPTTVKNQGEALQYVYDGGNSTWRQIGGSTIQRFVDHGADEVTAAVNNQSVDTQSASIGSVATDETHTKIFQDSVALISPSLPVGYNSISAAVNAGERHIAVAENITENNIPIPTVSLDEGFTLESIGSRSRITDPDQDGTPMLAPDDLTANSLDVEINDLDFAGGSGTGPLVDGNFRENGGTAHRWEFRRVRGDNTGPLVLMGADELVLDHCSVSTSTAATVTINGTDHTIGAGFVVSSQNLDLRGGDYKNKSDGGRFGGVMVACDHVNQYGATDVLHADNGGTAVAAWGFDNVSPMTMVTPVVDGPATAAPADMKFTDTFTGNGCSDVDVFEPQLTHGVIIAEQASDIDIHKPRGVNGTLEVTGAADITLHEGENTWTLGGNNPSNGMIVAGSNSRSGPNGGGTFELKDGEFLTDEAGKGAIVRTPDGTGLYRIRVDNSGNVVTDAL